MENLPKKDQGAWHFERITVILDFNFRLAVKMECHAPFLHPTTRKVNLGCKHEHFTFRKRQEERNLKTWGADSADGIASRRSDVSEAEDAALELEVGEEMRQAEVLVAVFATENLHRHHHNAPKQNHFFNIFHPFFYNKLEIEKITDLQQVSHVPLVAHHVVVRLPTTHPSRLWVHHDLLYHKSHSLQNGLRKENLAGFSNFSCTCVKISNIA